MKFELKKVDAVRTANVLAMVQGIIMSIFTLLMIPFLILMIVAQKSQFPGEPAPPAFALGFMIFVYPILGVISGWIGGLVFALIYNFIVRWTGGLLLELHNTTPTL